MEVVQAALSAPFEVPPFFFACQRASEVQLRLSSAKGEEPVVRPGEDLALVLEGVVRARGWCPAGEMRLIGWCFAGALAG